MITRRYSPTGLIMRSHTLNDQHIVIETTPRERIISGGGTQQETKKDSVYTTTESAQIAKEWGVSVLWNLETPQPKIINTTPGIATLSGSSLTHVSDGTAVIEAEGVFSTRREKLEVSQESVASSSAFENYVGGSLASHASDAVDSQIENKTLEDNGFIFTIKDNLAPNYERNTNVWCANYDLTCISPWNSSGGNRMAGTLITPRHIIFAKHYKIPTNSTIRFVDNENNPVNRTLTHRLDAPFGLDITVGLLNSDVPGEITPCEIAPALTTLESYSPGVPVSDERAIPCLALDQEEKALVHELMRIGPYLHDPDSRESCFYRYEGPEFGLDDPDRNEFHETIIGGDSGNPCFLLINGKLSLLSVWSTSGSGTFVSDPVMDLDQLISDIDSAASISTGYTTTVTDVSSFPQY